MSNFRFLARTALRDSRKNRGKLIMFMSSIVLGIAALVAINSFNYNLSKDIDRQTATLLGADVVISGNREASPAVLSSLDSLPGERASELELFSMAFLTEVEESQFVRIKALKGEFPFYGKIKTSPAEASSNYKVSGGALVDDGFMLQHGLETGDSIKLGKVSFKIEGRLQSTFGSSNVGSSFAPTVYIPQRFLADTELVRPGSLVNYAYYHKLPEGFSADDWKAPRRESFRNDNMRIETINDRKEDLDEAFSSLNYFLNLVAMVSLLLGCLGVASSVFIYIKSKIPSIAIFRCIGMKGNQAFLVYFLQIFALGISGVIFGTALGSFIQILIPTILSDFLPMDVTTSLSWKAITEGLLIGAIITILFALLPLISVRKISPLRTLRASFEGDMSTRDPLRWVIIIAIVLSIFAFLWRLTSDIVSGAVFTGGLVIAFLILFTVSKGMTWGVRKFFPRRWSFVLRQGLSNLYRPNNQTQTLLVSIGLGTAVLTTLFIIQGLLLNNVSQMDAGNQPNMILYGIESDQVDQLSEITTSYDLPIIQEVPVVTMKLEAWKGKTKAQWFVDTTRTARRWAINREARVSYRSEMDEAETLLRGTFTGVHDTNSDSIFISLGERYADGLDVDLGDEIVWNVQGTLLTTYVGSIRKLEFRSMATRFFILFPTGVLEEAPQFHVVVTKSPDTGTTAQYRSEVVKALPNVSVVDLGMILESLSDILAKVSYIIQFMAAFSILTGLIVLISSLLLSKFQRIKESVLLRTIGASRKQILRINTTEYALIGGLSALTGILISLVGSYFLTKYQLELDFDIQWMPILIVFFFVVSLTVIIGMLNSREVVNKPPLEVLRQEVG